MQKSILLFAKETSSLRNNIKELCECDESVAKPIPEDDGKELEESVQGALHFARNASQFEWLATLINLFRTGFWDPHPSDLRVIVVELDYERPTIEIEFIKAIRRAIKNVRNREFATMLVVATANDQVLERKKFTSLLEDCDAVLPIVHASDDMLIALWQSTFNAYTSGQKRILSLFRANRWWRFTKILLLVLSSLALGLLGGIGEGVGGWLFNSQ